MKMFNRNNNAPKKAPNMKGQVDQLWLAVFNHIPSRLNVIGLKINFIMAFMALVLALLAVIIVMIK